MPITKQTITFIGMQNAILTAVAREAFKGNYRILLCDHDKKWMRFLLNDIEMSGITADLETLHCSRLASWESDIIIVSAEKEELHAIAKKIEDVATQKVVCRILASEEFDEQTDFRSFLPHSKKAEISGVISGKQNCPLKIRSDHAEAMQVAYELVTAAGYRVECTQWDLSKKER